MTRPPVPKAPPYTVVIGSADPVQLASLCRAVEDDPRMLLGAALEMPVQAADMAKQLGADIVVLVDESPGLRGRDLLGELGRELPVAKVIITTDGDPCRLAEHTTVAASLADRDDSGVRAALDALAAWFADPETATVERRHIGDRRRRQDWTKVFAERRHADRRH